MAETSSASTVSVVADSLSAAFALEYSVLAEYTLLQKQSIPSVYMIPSAKTPLVWFGVIFVRHGIYQDGVFRFSLKIPENFPDGTVPQLFFETPIFHPRVNPETLEFDVARYFGHRWRRNVNHLWQILVAVRGCFYKVDADEPLNAEASSLYLRSQELFIERVRACVDHSLETVYDTPTHEDPHDFVFSVYQPVLHDPIHDQLKKQKKRKSSSEKTENCVLSQGLSWVKPGSMQMFSNTS